MYAHSVRARPPAGTRFARTLHATIARKYKKFRGDCQCIGLGRRRFFAVLPTPRGCTEVEFTHRTGLYGVYFFAHNLSLRDVRQIAKRIAPIRPLPPHKTCGESTRSEVP